MVEIDAEPCAPFRRERPSPAGRDRDMAAKSGDPHPRADTELHASAETGVEVEAERDEADAPRRCANARSRTADHRDDGGAKLD